MHRQDLYSRSGNPIGGSFAAHSSSYASVSSQLMRNSQTASSTHHSTQKRSSVFDKSYIKQRQGISFLKLRELQEAQQLENSILHDTKMRSYTTTQ